MKKRAAHMWKEELPRITVTLTHLCFGSLLNVLFDSPMIFVVLYLAIPHPPDASYASGVKKDILPAEAMHDILCKLKVIRYISKCFRL